MTVGRFAPSPSGRMHLGNVFAALLAWCSVRNVGGTLLLRLEDLDPDRCKPVYGDQIKRDLEWLGLDWDREAQPQSQRGEVYRSYLDRLEALGLLYPCYCTRDQLLAPSAPHRSDGRRIYPGTCRDLTPAQRAAMTKAPALRLRVPDRTYTVHDGLQGDYSENLEADCGDFIVCRADGVCAYQLAVVVDDGLSGVTQVVRGRDLLDSTPRQQYLQELLGFPIPETCHVPLLITPEGRRISKRERDLDLGVLQSRMSPEILIGALAHTAGLLDRPRPITPRELAADFSWSRVRREDQIAPFLT